MQPPPPPIPPTMPGRPGLPGFLPWVTIGVGALFAFAWGFTGSPAALCGSVLGQVAQLVSPSTAGNCQAATAIHMSGVLAHNLSAACPSPPSSGCSSG